MPPQAERYVKFNGQFARFDQRHRFDGLHGFLRREGEKLNATRLVAKKSVILFVVCIDYSLLNESPSKSDSNTLCGC